MNRQKKKAKKWVDKMLSQNLVVANPISSEEFTHDTDKDTLAALEKIPLLDKLCSKFLEIFNEPFRRIHDMSSKIKITDKQLPRVYNMVANICKKLNINMPNLYLELDREPNAYTYGDKIISITVTSGLLECMDDDELYAVLAHECGHIACRHVLYHTIGSHLLNGTIKGISLIGNGAISNLISLSLRLAFFNWMRCSELSADRAAVLCCGSAEPIIKVMMRFSGGTMHINAEIDSELFMQQANDYKELTNEKKINKFVEFLVNGEETHPLNAVRAKEANEYFHSEECQRLIERIK